MANRNLSRDTPPPGHGRIGRWLIAYPRAVPIAIFLAILSITGVSVFSIESGELQRDRAQMAEAAQSAEAALERRGSTNASYLRAGAALFATVDRVRPAMFNRFVSELKLDTDYRGTEGIGWAEAITPAEIPDYEKRITEQTGSSLRVNPEPAEGTDRLVPVTFLLPNTERNRRALGYDMYSQPTRRAAMDEAERMVRPTASGKIVLVQEGTGDAPGFLIYMPVFEDTLTGRELRGYIYSPFNAQIFLESALGNSALGGIGLRLYDGSSDDENLIASRPPVHATGLVLTRRVEIANRQFLLEIESARGESLSSLSMATLLFGLSVAGLLMVLVRLMTQQAREDEARIEYYAEQNSIRNSLVRELNHRVKNTLANVLSIASLTRRRTDNLDEFASALDGRIRALSATHDLLTKSDWGTTLLRDVAEAELAPYSAGFDSTVELIGPAVELAPNDALSLGLALHELATNAAKYGALSRKGGKVTITWDMAGEDGAIIRWQESGGPQVEAQRKPGFGTELIEKIIAHELKSPVKLEFPPEGVRCELRVPVRRRGEFKIREGTD
ncbi:CHASE domain-containing protein [Altererythrobacter sp.]|uniref:CHASE domain-containing protein n=1 Tax=Altererythrobacter sp. TaxID=1872480 RepID=UPI003D06D04A